MSKLKLRKQNEKEKKNAIIETKWEWHFSSSVKASDCAAVSGNSEFIAPSTPCTA
jgi:hypothetical protein